jgi:hypothetical protein
MARWPALCPCPLNRLVGLGPIHAPPVHRERGKSWQLIEDEDVLVFRTPAFPGGSRELKGPQRELKGPAQRFFHDDPAVAGELGAAA